MPSDFMFCANCLHPAYVHADFNRRAAKSRVDLSRHPVFFGVPDLARRITANTGSVCYCGKTIDLSRLGPHRDTFRWRPFSLHGGRIQEGRYTYKLRVALGIEPKFTYKSYYHAFNDDERVVLIDRYLERLIEWTKTHRVYTTDIENRVRGYSGVTQAESIDERIAEQLYRMDLKPGTPEYEQQRQYMVDSLHKTLHGNACNAVNDVLSESTCNCTGFVPMSVTDVIDRAYAHNGMPPRESEVPDAATV